MRDWEDGLKGQKRTIYKEWRNNTMSLKEWKNKELNTLLVEKWGFGKIQEAKGEKGDADPLDGEREKFDKDLDGVPDGADKDKDDPEIKEEIEENLEESDEAMEERLTQEIAAKMLQNEGLLNKLRGK